MLVVGEVRMLIAQGVLNYDLAADWGADWAWGLPLVVLTVVIHVLGLAMIRRRVIKATRKEHHPAAFFAVMMTIMTLLATTLHGIEAFIWATAFQLLHALPDRSSAMLYSLNAITSYGHENLNLSRHWELLGAIEALNGWLLFGLTTAFLFAMIQDIWLSEEKPQRAASMKAGAD